MTRPRPMRPAPACAALVALGLLRLPIAGASSAPFDAPVVRIDYYYETGCEECRAVDADVIPHLRQQYGASVDLHHRDLGIASNYLRLAAAMERAGRDDNAPVFMILDRSEILAGYSEILENLFLRLDERLTDPVFALPAAPPPDPYPPDDLLARRMDRFTTLSVMAGGLIDGLNPCAISTLVFLMSVLTMTRAGGRRLLLVGTVFCLASFLTYLAIGFGLLRALHLLAHFERIRLGVEWTMSAALTILAAFSLRDALRFRRSHNPSDVTLQLPPRTRERIHRLLKSRLGPRAQLASAFVAGAAVTALESVCTGQVYVPTLVLVVRSGSRSVLALAYLVLYNAMFVLPLFVALLLTVFGLKVTRLIEWSVANVFASKLLLAAFFLFLAAAILLLR